jgi:signal transduction histidine kinase
MMTRSRPIRSARLAPYLQAIAGVAIAALATKGLEELLGPSISLLFFPAIFIPAMSGRYGPAILATVLSTLTLAFFFIPPKNSWTLGLDDMIRLAVFAGIACSTAWLSSARRRAEEAERQSALSIAARSQELAVREDRLRVSRDLHDGVLQALTGIRLELQDVASSSPPESAIHDRLLAAERALAVEQRELRRLIDGLRPDPAIVGAAGTLLATLRTVVARLAVEWKTPVTVRVTPEQLALPDALEQSVRLMLHEAIVNALQHAHPSRVSVSVEHKAGELRLSIVDDGRGFPFHERLNHAALVDRNLGPATLRDRVASLNGRMMIDSTARGSRVDLVMPFDPSVNG